MKALGFYSTCFFIRIYTISFSIKPLHNPHVQDAPKVNVICMPTSGKVKHYFMKLAKEACFPNPHTDPTEFKVEVCHFRHKSFPFLPFSE